MELPTMSLIDPHTLNDLLVVSPAGIGNSILATPLITALKDSLSDVRLAVATGSQAAADLLGSDPAIDESVALPTSGSWSKKISALARLRRRRFDLCITTSPSNRPIYHIFGWLIKPRFHVIHQYVYHPLHSFAWLPSVKVEADPALHDVEQNLRLLEPLGLAVNEVSPVKIWLNDEELQEVDEWVQAQELPAGDILAVHPSTSTDTPYKTWGVGALADMAAAANRIASELELAIVIIAGPGETQSANSVAAGIAKPCTVVEGWPIRRVAALLSRVRLLLNFDSGLGHIAAAVGTATVTVFGMSDPVRTRPWGEQARVVTPDLDCAPCYKYPHYNTKPIIRCGDHGCLKHFSVEEVVQAAS